MGSYSAYKAQQVDRLTDRVKELEAERDRLRDGIRDAAESVDGWHDSTRDQLLSLLNGT